MAFAAKQGLDGARLARELDQFRDHWTAKSGRDAVKRDWQAAWRTWVRNAVEFKPPEPDAAATASTAAQEANRRFQAEQAAAREASQTPAAKEAAAKVRQLIDNGVIKRAA
jgi:hypothetical protein